MPNDCKDCVQSVEVENLKNIIADMKVIYQDHEKRIAKLERHNDANEERFKTLFNCIDEIKKDITSINSKLDMLINKPGENWNEAIKVVIAVVITAAVTYFLKK